MWGDNLSVPLTQPTGREWHGQTPAGHPQPRNLCKRHLPIHGRALATLPGISVGRIPRGSRATAKAWAVTCWSSVTVKAGGCEAGKERTVEQSPVLEGVLLKSEATPCLLQEWHSSDPKFLEAVVPYFLFALCPHTALTQISQLMPGTGSGGLHGVVSPAHVQSQVPGTGLGDAGSPKGHQATWCCYRHGADPGDPEERT